MNWYSNSVSKITTLFLFGFFLVLATLSPAHAAPNFPLPPSDYIVVLRTDTNPTAVAHQMALTHGISLGHIYSSAIKGFAAVVPLSRLPTIARDPRVLYLTPDRPVNILDQEINAKGGKPSPVQPSQTIPTGLSRINATSLNNSGSGIGVAVIDTGIDLTHPDLAANIVANVNCLNSRKTGNDDNGHGTHVAGTIAALDNSIGSVGIAPQAKLLAVKVLNSAGSGTWSSVICGIDWVTAHVSNYQIKVANLSLGGAGYSDNNCGVINNDPLHQAICASSNAGITYVAAAGNESSDTSSSVPAAYDDAVITVSALADSDGLAGGLGNTTVYGPDDTFASFSNFGSVVDLAAPGVSIYSTYKGSSYATLSGTSMATPHVTGALAIYFQAHPSNSWTQALSDMQNLGESLDSGHTDPSGLHPESLLDASSL